MIFPVLRGLLHPIAAPVTYFLFLVNLVVFGATYADFERADQLMDSVLDDNEFLEVQGAAFAVLIQQEPEPFSSTLKALAQKALDGESDSRRMLGSLALRNVDFMSRAEKFDFGGDEIAVSRWREKFVELKEFQDQHPSFQWGISRLRDGWMQWLTYQFSHSGWTHLFWNMVFLVLFGCFIEATLGGSFVILTYLGGGLSGAIVFSQLSGISSSPLVGASAAVSALMALVAIRYWGQKKIRHFYWLLPIEGYYGFVFLPSWLILVVSMLPDLSGYLAASRDFGSVAYAAHLGGSVWGAAMAILLGLGWMVKEVVEDSAETQDGWPFTLLKDDESGRDDRDSNGKDDQNRHAS